MSIKLQSKDEQMKKILTLILLMFAFSTVSIANENVPYDACRMANMESIYYMDGNGYIQQYPQSNPKQRYIPWTYLDENGYDYTILIEIQR